METSNQNLKYYDQHASEYSFKTSKFDMSAIRKEFMTFLPKGGTILDAGCGPGWDILGFLEHGFQVEAFDASESMVNIAKKNTGISIRKMFFQEMDYENNFDGVWANASLLHIGQDELLPVIKKISTSLKQGGHFFASFKYGQGTLFENGRWFTMMTETELMRIIKSFSEFNLLRIWKSKDVGKRKNLEWINFIIQKTDC